MAGNRRGNSRKPAKSAAGKHSKSNRREEASVSSQRIEFPDDLDERYRPYFDSIVEDMDERKINSKSFVHIVRHLAVTLFYIDECVDQMAADGPVIPGARGNPTANPAFQVYDKLTTKAATLCAILGMTPKDRTSVFPLETEDAKTNEKDQILGGPQITISPDLRKLKEDD